MRARLPFVPYPVRLRATMESGPLAELMEHSLRRDRHQRLAVRSREDEFAGMVAADLVHLIVEAAMVETAQRHEVGDLGHPTVGPVTDTGP
jgi:hypothetical protein